MKTLVNQEGRVRTQPKSKGTGSGFQTPPRLLISAAFVGVAYLAVLFVFDLGETLRAAPPATLSMIEPSGPPEAGKYWPRWRGPSGQGLAAGSGYPDTWSDDGPNSKNILWKVKVPGSGNSSPIIWGDRIYLTTAYDGGRRRSILCLRRSDGKQLWETFAPEAAPENANPNPKNGHASGRRRPMATVSMPTLATTVC